MKSAQTHVPVAIRLVVIATVLIPVLGIIANLQADEGQNPYASIAKRNVFGLVSPPLAETVQVRDAVPVPEIKVCGFVSLFEHPLVLFKVAGIPEPGKIVTETSHMLEAGQEEEEVKLLQIQDRGNKFVFDNHGIVQTVFLAEVVASWEPPPIASETNAPMPSHWGSYAFLEKKYNLNANPSY